MLTLNDTALNDNQARFVVKIESDTAIYLSNYLDGITLSSILYDGVPLVKNSLQDNGKSIDISNGGGIGNIQAFQLQIARYQTNTSLNEFFNDLFPATGKQYLIARPISIGFCWEGATTAGEITWFFYGYIDEYSYNADTITLLCLEYAELENIELPYYKVQKENNNGVSYFPNVNENNLGASIPIVYGDFTIQNRTKEIYVLSPCVLVDPTNSTFVIASHKFETTSLSLVETDEYALFHYVSSSQIYVRLSKISGTTASNAAYHSITMQEVLDSVVYGDIIIPFKLLGSQSDYEITNVADQDDSTYLQVNDGNTVNIKTRALEIGGIDLYQFENYNLGCPVYVTFRLSSSDANDRDFTINYLNTKKGASPGTAGTGSGVLTLNTGLTITNYEYNMRIDVGGKIDSGVWTLKELSELEFTMENNSGAGDPYIRVYGGFLRIENIQMSKFTHIDVSMGYVETKIDKSKFVK